MNKLRFVGCIVLSLFVSIAFIAGCGTVEKNSYTSASINPATHISTVDAGSDVGQFSSLALDGAGMPHICYFDNTNQTVKYASWDGITWETETVDSSAGYCSLALDSHNNPHICYLKNSTDLQYAVKTGGKWKIVNIDFHANYPSPIVLDSAGNPYIIYVSHAADINYVSMEGGAFTSPQQVTDESGVNLSLALSHNNPYIMCYLGGFGGYNVEYATFESGSWDEGPYIYSYSSDLSPVVLDSAGNAYLSFQYSSYLTLISMESGSFPGSPRDVTTEAAQYISLKLDSHDLPKISYYDSTNKVLKYTIAYSSTSETVLIDDSSADIGQFTSLALDSAGKPRISYYDAANKTLKYYWQ